MGVNKTKAKAAGVKSTFVLEDGSLLMTSFGKGNDAIVEKKIVNDMVTDLQDPNNYDVEVEEKYLNITKGKLTASVDKPCDVARDDMLHLKSILEKEFYGQEFKDNMKIQVVYNILDIKKIFSQYINTICYAVNSLARGFKKNSSGDEFIGTLNSYVSYEDYKTKNGELGFEDFCNAARGSYCYFPEVFYASIDKKGKGTERNIKDIYTALQIVSAVRQSLTHEKTAFDYIYKCEKSLSKEKIQLLNEIFNKKVDEINDSFIENNAKINLPLLFDVYSANQELKNKIFKNYYNFVVKKDSLNLGFSLKKLREKILSLQDAKEYANEIDKSVKHKAYQLIDFVLYDYFINRPSEINSIVSELRENTQDKDRIYLKRANKIWILLDKKICFIINKMKGDSFSKYLGSGCQINKQLLEEVKISSDVSIFAKLVYFLSLFLDGKEINDFISGLASKFDNIYSLQTALKYQNDGAKLKSEYDQFNDSEKLFKELMLVKSFARMTKDTNYGNRQYVEALELLGYVMPNDKAEKEIVDNLLYEPKQDEKQKSKPKPIRNFLANNVLESSRFKYIVKYTDAATACKIGHCSNIVLFVLNRINESLPDQIKKYCLAVGLTFNNNAKEMIPKLANEVTNISFSTFKTVVQKVVAGSPDEKDKNKKIALIQLYLTVIYQVVKGLLNVNSRYLIGIYNLEKDFHYYNFNFNKTHDLDVLTKLFIEKGYLGKKATCILNDNLKESDNDFEHAYRNKIAHFNVITYAYKYLSEIKKPRNYFEIYHYVMQRLILDESFNSNNNIILKFLNDAKNYGVYNKNFVKVINLPFGYNYARYKNLSISGLFDMNEPGTTKEDCEFERIDK